MHMARKHRVEEPVMPKTGDAPVPGWLTALGVVLAAWAVYYLVLSVR